MTYFTDDYVAFFKELANNNTKEWFNDNRKRYENSVKKPFKFFVQELIEAVKVHEPNLDLQPKDCISRINRDIRFSKDKTPYNLHLNAFVSQGGKKNKSIPGLYVRLSPEMVGVMGGSYGLEKEQLANVRNALTTSNKEFRALISEKKFASSFGGILGEKMKRIPKEYKEAVLIEPLILNKSYYYMTEIDADIISSDSLVDTIMEHYHIMAPVNAYLRELVT